MHRLERLEGRSLLAAAAASVVGDLYSAPADPRVALDLDAGWKFIKSNPANAQAAGFNDASWAAVNLPHTWNNLDGQDGGKNYYRGVGWYRKSFTVPTALVGDTLRLRFDGASMAAKVYIDGQLIGSHNGAFASFDFDVTNKLGNGGTHTLAVQVDNSNPGGTIAPISGDFTIFGGLYRGVSLVGTNAQHVMTNDMASPGVQFSTPSVSSSSASVQVKSGITNDATFSRDLIVHTVLTDASGQIVAETSTPRTLAAGETASVTQQATVDNPHLWNGRPDPYLHNLYVEVRDAGSDQLLDLVTQRVGIRTYQITSNGFFLNGQLYDVHGVNMHQDRINKGWAISDADIREDIDLLMDIGATGLRTAHYQQSQLLYDLADEKGLIVYTEIPNVGSSNSGDIPTSAGFANSAQQQLRELIRQNFNHASIVVWGLFNEVDDVAFNRNFVATLNTIAHAEDPTRRTVGASWNNNVNELEKVADVAAYNRYWGWYYNTAPEFGPELDRWHSQNPNVEIAVSEYGAGGAISQHEANPKAPAQGGTWHPEEYQAIYHEQTWKLLESRPWLWGTFVWNMFDFASDGRAEGEAPGRNDKGLVTYDRKTKKDSYYFYKANWSDDAVAYITSRRWTERTDPKTQIKVYSNASNPTLTLNGVPVALTNQGNNVWLSPTVTLAAGANVVIVSGVRNGQTVNDSVTWNYGKAPTPPPTNPQLAVVASAFNAANKTFSVDFNKAINTSSLSAKDLVLKLTTNSSTTVSAASMTYDATLRRATFTFTAIPVGTYVATMTASAVNDTASKSMVPFTSAAFTVAAPQEPNPTPTPLVITSGSYDSSARKFTVEFNQPIDVSSLSATDLVLKSTSGQSVSASSFTYDSTTRRAVFSFAAFTDGTYVAAMAASAVKDTTGNGVSAFTSASFTVATPTIPPPTTAQLAVTSGVFNATANTFTVEFNKPVNTSSLSAKDLVLTRNGSTAVSATGKTYDATTRRATFTFATLSPGSYVASMTATAANDTSGKSMKAYTSAAFTIASPTPNPPATDPAFAVFNSFFTIGDSPTYMVEFNKAITTTSLSAKDLVLTLNGSTTVAATSMVYDATLRRATFSFARLPAGSYVVTMSASAVLDAKGNKLTPFASTPFTV